MNISTCKGGLSEVAIFIYNNPSADLLSSIDATSKRKKTNLFICGRRENCQGEVKIALRTAGWTYPWNLEEPEAHPMNEERSEAPHEAPLLCKARFGPGTVALLSFIAVAAILYYSFSMITLALLIGGVGVLFFGVKSMERIELIRIQDRNLIGEICRVVKPIRIGQLGIVRIIKPDGKMESELWSAESTHEIEAGKKARVIGTRSIVLLIDPLTQEASRSSSQVPLEVQ